MVKSEENIVTKTNDMLTPQAKLFALGYLLIYISIIMTMVTTKMYSNASIVSLIANFLVFILSVYVVNCTVTGNCNFYAWFVAYLFVAIGIILSIGAFVMMAKN